MPGRSLYEAFFEPVKGSDMIALMQTMADMDPEQFPEEQREKVVEGVLEAARHQGSLKLAGVEIDTETLMFGVLFPGFTAAMIAGEALSRAGARELGASEQVQGAAGLAGGLVAGFGGPYAAGKLARQATVPAMRGILQKGELGTKGLVGPAVPEAPILSERIGAAAARGFAEDVYATGPGRAGEALERAATERFGTIEALFDESGTVRSAGGMLLRDGRVVDLGGAGAGRMAHEEAIASLVLPTKLATEPLMTFMRDTGAVRMAVGRTEEVFVEIAGPITKAQRVAILREWDRSAGAVVEAISPAGRSVRSVEVGYEPAAKRTLSRFLDDLEHKPPAEWGESLPVGAGEYVPRRKPLGGPEAARPAVPTGWKAGVEEGVVRRTVGKVEVEGRILPDHVETHMIGKATVGDFREVKRLSAQLAVETGKPYRTFATEPTLAKLLRRDPNFTEIERYVPEGLKDFRAVMEKRTGRALKTEPGAPQFEMSVEQARRVVGKVPSVEEVAFGAERAVAGEPVFGAAERYAAGQRAPGAAGKIEGSGYGSSPVFEEITQAGERIQVPGAGQPRSGERLLTITEKPHSMTMMVELYGGSATKAQVRAVWAAFQDSPKGAIGLRAMSEGGYEVRGAMTTTKRGVQRFFNDVAKNPPRWKWKGPRGEEFGPVEMHGGPKLTRAEAAKLPAGLRQIARAVKGFPSPASRRVSEPTRVVKGEPTAPPKKRPKLKAETPAGTAPPKRPPTVPPEGEIPSGAPPPDEGELLDRVVRLIRGAKRPGREQELLRWEERKKRYAKAMDAIERAPEGERLRMAKGMLTGEQPKLGFEPIAQHLTEGETLALINRVLDFNFGAGRGFKKIRGADAFLAALGGKVPTTSELVILEQVFGPEIVRALKSKRPWTEKIFWEILDVAGIPRTALTILDHSFPGRQGIKLAPSHPTAWKNSAWQGLRAMKSEKVAKELAEARRLDSTPILVRYGDEVRVVPYGALKEEIGVFEAPFGEAGAMVGREEAFISRWARWIPGVKLSERAYITAGNEIRHDVVKHLLVKATEAGDPISIETARGYANLVNRASGRGTLKPFLPNEFAPLLNVAMFAPRYRIAAPQWAAHLFHSNKAVRGEAWSQFWKFFTAGTTLLAVVKYGVPGADVNVDPRSSDFGKIKIGKTRIDFWAHMQQMARTAALLAEGQRVTSTGEAISTGRLDAAWRYFRTGASPLAGLIIDSLEGESLIGDPIELSKEGIRTQLWNRLAPLAFQDLVDSIREEGLRGGLISSLAFGGIGIQTYETDAQKRAKAFKQETGMDFDYDNPGHWAVIRTDPAFEDFAGLSDQAQETQEFLTEEMKTAGLPEMAAALMRGDPVGPAFKDAWEDFEGTRADAAARLAYGREEGVPDDTSYINWRNITREQFQDPVTFEYDYGAYYAAKDAAFELIPQPIKDALLQVGAPDPAVAEYATRLVEARRLRRGLYDISKWQGLTPEQSQELDAFIREVGEQAPLIAQQLGQRISEKDVAQWLADQRGTPQLAEWFEALQSSTERDRLRNPEYESFIRGNRAQLQMWFPELYSQAAMERMDIIEGAPSSFGMQPMEATKPMGPMRAQ
jgi:hypothetical protein